VCCAIHSYRDSFSLCLHAPSSPALFFLSLHDALPICTRRILIIAAIIVLGALVWAVLALSNSSEESQPDQTAQPAPSPEPLCRRSEEHTSELQSRFDLVCRLLLEKKKNKRSNAATHIA